ncbi:hypothetical protein [Lysobacter firmicutimachus]|uniref:Beta-lactamase n=1 Tax=Lysobacter firmicutimachus TaxID=1792846 RepID=A0ABU8D7W5_9GAMM
MRILRAIPLLLCFALAPSAFAADAPCGTYDSGEEYDGTLSFDGERAIAHDREGFVSPQGPYRYRIDGDRVRVRNADSTLSTEYKLLPDGDLERQPSLFEPQPKRLKRVKAATCAAHRNDGVAYAAGQDNDSAADCAAGDVQSCVDVLSYDPEGKQPDRLRKLERHCREDRSPYACEVWAKALTPSEADAPLVMFRTDALSPASIAALRIACDDIGSGGACESLAEQEWIAGRYASTRAISQSTCDRRLSKNACDRAARWTGTALRDAPPRQSPRQPCGWYVSDDGSLFGGLRFDDGNAALSEDDAATMPYRLREDEVLVRHDKGDDFVLRWIDADTLVGQDDWTRYHVYRRARAGQCAPIALPQPGSKLRETAYKVDQCALTEPGGAEACCARGSMSACMGIGHVAALGGDWKGAAAAYDKVCAMHVREGCGNVVSAYLNAGDDALLAGIRKVCAEHSDSVACEELRMATPERATEKQLERELGEALQQALQGVGEKTEADQD